MTNFRDQWWAYIAGFFDGEGCITRWQNGGKGSDSTFHLKITVAQVEWRNQVLKDIQEWCGYGRVRKNVLIITGKKNLLNFLENVQPYSIVKKPQIDLAIEFLELMNSQGNYKLPRHARERREEIIRELDAEKVRH